MKHKPACTMRTVAAHLGISPATVSRALRGDPRITEAVRLKVVKAANKLGYKRDHKMAELMSLVRATKKRAFQGTLAWITDQDVKNPAECRVLDLYWKHAETRAGELGYKLLCHPNSHPGDAPRLARLLHAQGIQGIIIQQFKMPFQPADWQMNWKQFAIIYNGSSQTIPTLDSVVGDGLANCDMLLQTLATHGYQRMGIATTLAIEEATNHILCTSMSRHLLQNPARPGIPPCLLPDLGPDSARTVAHWIKQHHVDCIVSQVRGMKELLEEMGIRVPHDLGLAYQGVNPNGDNSGINQRVDIIATAVIETLAASVEQGRFGLPAVPRRISIPGTWQQGTTCR